MPTCSSSNVQNPLGVLRDRREDQTASKEHAIDVLQEIVAVAFHLEIYDQHRHNRPLPRKMTNFIIRKAIVVSERSISTTVFVDIIGDTRGQGVQ